MFTVSSQRMCDIHELNEKYLNLIAGASTAAELGLAEDVFRLIQSWTPEQRKQVSQTDILLFSFSQEKSAPSGTESREKFRELIGHLNLVARDFAYAAPNFAATHLGLSRHKSRELLAMGTAQIQENSHRQHERLKIIPLGGIGFRMLEGMDNALERTRYVALSANDERI